MNDTINTINGLLFSDYTVYTLLAVGLLFTVWSGFGQYRALTHGIAVVYQQPPITEGAKRRHHDGPFPLVSSHTVPHVLQH